MTKKRIFDTKPIASCFFAEAQDDIVGLWEIIYEIEERYIPSAEVREKT